MNETQDLYLRPRPRPFVEPRVILPPIRILPPPRPADPKLVPVVVSEVSAKVRIRGEVASTEFEAVVTNPNTIALEGEFTLPLPAGATVTGAALDIRLHPSAVSGENGLAALAGLFRTFVLLNGFFMQTDVIDSSVLLAAREHPEEYKTLSVRVSGWNARFVTLNREWQDMIIQRTSGGTV